MCQAGRVRGMAARLEKISMAPAPGSRERRQRDEEQIDDAEEIVKVFLSSLVDAGPCFSYWERKLRDEDRPQHLAPTLVEWDMAVGAWHDMEEQTGLITQFCHMGPAQSFRKVLSYDGIPDEKGDRGNWVYGVCLRTMLCLFEQSDWRYVSTQQLNDEKAGDILEAIWGLLWHRQTGGPLANRVIADSLVPTQQLQGYCKCMTRVVLIFEQLYPQFLRPFEWPSSKSLATALI